MKQGANPEPLLPIEFTHDDPVAYALADDTSMIIFCGDINIVASTFSFLRTTCFMRWTAGQTGLTFLPNEFTWNNDTQQTRATIASFFFNAAGNPGIADGDGSTPVTAFQIAPYSCVPVSDSTVMITDAARTTLTATVEGPAGSDNVCLQYGCSITKATIDGTDAAVHVSTSNFGVGSAAAGASATVSEFTVVLDSGAHFSFQVGIVLHVTVGTYLPATGHFDQTWCTDGASSPSRVTEIRQHTSNSVSRGMVGAFCW